MLSTRSIAAQLPPAPRGVWKPPFPKHAENEGRQWTEGNWDSVPERKHLHLRRGKKKNCTGGCDTTNLGCKSGSEHTQSMSSKEWKYLRWNQANCRDKKGSKSFVCTTQSCVAFRRRTAFASRTMNILKASFHQWLGKIIPYAASTSSAKANVSCTRWVFCKLTPRALDPAHLTRGHHRARLCRHWLCSFWSAQSGKGWKKLTPEMACEMITLNAELPCVSLPPPLLLPKQQTKPLTGQMSVCVWTLWVLSVVAQILCQDTREQSQGFQWHAAMEQKKNLQLLSTTFIFCNC